MAPRCVCSRMEGGEAAAVCDFDSEPGGAVCVLTTRKCDRTLLKLSNDAVAIKAFC